jgi:hypothetical protein
VGLGPLHKFTRLQPQFYFGANSGAVYFSARSRRSRRLFPQAHYVRAYAFGAVRHSKRSARLANVKQCRGRGRLTWPRAAQKKLGFTQDRDVK